MRLVIINGARPTACKMRNNIIVDASRLLLNFQQPQGCTTLNSFKLQAKLRLKSNN